MRPHHPHLTHTPPTQPTPGACSTHETLLEAVQRCVARAKLADAHDLPAIVHQLLMLSAKGCRDTALLVGGVGGCRYWWVGRTGAGLARAMGGMLQLALYARGGKWTWCADFSTAVVTHHAPRPGCHRAASALFLHPVTHPPTPPPTLPSLCPPCRRWCASLSIERRRWRSCPAARPRRRWLAGSCWRWRAW